MADTTTRTLPSGFDVLARAVHELIEMKLFDAAAVLVRCRVDMWFLGKTVEEGEELLGVRIMVPWGLTSALEGGYDDEGIPNNMSELMVAFDDAFPTWAHPSKFEVKEGPVSNQGLGASSEWNGFWFRSQTEIRIAQALDRQSVLFLPNCKARLGIVQDARGNREPDFLICENGRWGILEIDGEPWHPPSRTVHDHSRDREFLQHRISLVQHFDANECYDTPDEVITEFLRLLRGPS